MFCLRHRFAVSMACSYTSTQKLISSLWRLCFSDSVNEASFYLEQLSSRSSYHYLVISLARLLHRLQLLTVLFITRPMGKEHTLTRLAAANSRWMQGVSKRMGGLPTKRGWKQNHIYSTGFYLYVLRYLTFPYFSLLIPRMCT